MMSTGSSTNPTTAAFFDVDGTITKTNIVHYYVYFRRQMMEKTVGTFWQSLFMLKCICYLYLDYIDRSRLNVVFYRNYTNLDAEQIKAMMPGCYDAVLKPRLYPLAPICIQAHRHAGRRIVFVTGSLDFIIKPLADELGVDHVIANKVTESSGRFTGELAGKPIIEDEKGRCIKAYAKKHNVDLAHSYAYADSVSDMPMLDAVGHPQVVNPDKRLERLALEKAWPVHKWTLEQQTGN